MKIPKIINVSYSVSKWELDKNIGFMRPQIIDSIYRQLAAELHGSTLK